MMRLKLSVNSLVFGQPLKQAAETAASLGAEALQVDARNQLKPSELSDTGVRQLKHFLKERGLTIESVSFPLRSPLIEPERVDARVAAIKDALSWTHRLGAGVLTARIGRIPTDTESRDYATLLEILNDLARHGNRIGTSFCLIPSNDTIEGLKNLFNAVTWGPIALDCDPAALIMGGQDPGDGIRALHDRILHVRIRDAIRDMDGNGQEVAVGRGEVDWEEFLSLLDEAAYRGWMTVDRTQGDAKPLDAGRAIQFLRTLQEEL